MAVMVTSLTSCGAVLGALLLLAYGPYTDFGVAGALEDSGAVGFAKSRLSSLPIASLW